MPPTRGGFPQLFGYNTALSNPRAFPSVNQTGFGRHRREPHWHSPSAAQRARVPAPQLGWLLDDGSLTRRLLAACGEAFRVAPLSQGWRRPLLNEAGALGMRPAHYAFVREVHLLCGDRPWVFARTVIPPHTLAGERRRLARLGDKPLGAVLFADRSMRRSPVQIARLRPGQWLFDAATTPLASTPAEIWGRRSLFWLGGHPLLVNEIFLPGLGD